MVRPFLIYGAFILCIMLVALFPQHADLQENNTNLSIKHDVQDGTVFVECYIGGYTLREEANEEQAPAQLTVLINGSKHSVQNQAAFRLQDLEEGSHQICIEVTDQEGTSYEEKECFKATIK
ncbi:hypothetical protein [Salsuginibacillus kocurii]|uniref:hypothetical protein n=1 Tax=Salsuginibacillus kocurii TaxID=427078 RepID=UPI00037030FE|nr:hypothetical protein [Salsuginibacillus kocurii]